MVKRDLITNIILCIVAIIAFLFLRFYVFSTVKITENDANEFIHENDVVVINKNESPKRLDFVKYEVDGNQYIGRIVADEADKVTYMDDIFYLNDQVEEEEYIEVPKAQYFSSRDDGVYFTDDFTLQTLTDTELEEIPSNQYLILNDNRRDKEDSRTFGLIKESQIKGVLTFRILPLADFGFIETSN